MLQLTSFAQVVLHEPIPSFCAKTRPEALGRVDSSFLEPKSYLRPRLGWPWPHQGTCTTFASQGLWTHADPRALCWGPIDSDFHLDSLSTPGLSTQFSRGAYVKSATFFTRLSLTIPHPASWAGLLSGLPGDLLI